MSNFGKKKVIRRRRKKGTGSKPYFHQGTQDAIVAFQNSNCQKEKTNLYESEIQPAFDKLVENLIFIHNFVSLHDSYEDLKSDCVTFLYQTIPKFDAEKGTKAFSYFNIVAKHFLIIKSKQRSNKIKRNICIDEPDLMGFAEQEALREYCTVPSPDDQMIEKQFINEIIKLFGEIKKRLKNESEHRTMDSIMCIFEHIESLDLFNKRAVLFYIREMTGMSSKQLTTNMAVIKKHFRELRGDDEFGIF